MRGWEVVLGLTLLKWDRACSCACVLTALRAGVCVSERVEAARDDAGLGMVHIVHTVLKKIFACRHGCRCNMRVVMVKIRSART